MANKERFHILHAEFSVVPNFATFFQTKNGRGDPLTKRIRKEVFEPFPKKRESETISQLEKINKYYQPMGEKNKGSHK